jgi:pimeloyl-ACP methyl ester carboxylesterase
MPDNSSANNRVTTFESAGGVALRIFESGAGPIDLIWAHGWGQSHHAFEAVVSGLSARFRHLMLDFPGFGGLLPPPAPWSTEEYAELAAQWMATLPRNPRIWIGHSFGCRIGIRLASNYQGGLDGMVLIAAAGVRPRVRAGARISRFFKGLAFRTLKRLAPSESARERLRNAWGSSDYRNAGAMRPTLVRVVNEDLSEAARNIHIPVLLLYGNDDVDTPVTVGRLFNALIPGSRLEILPKYGHLNILDKGRFQLQSRIRSFIQDIGL